VSFLLFSQLYSSYLSQAYDLQETPVFIPVNSIIPRMPLQLGNTIGRLSRQYSSLAFAVYPGLVDGAGQTQVYEDDAATTAYLSG
jgi:hypothetical protein